MTSRTHDLAALTALNASLLLLHIPKMSLATVIAALTMCFIGGIIPDMDKPTSNFWDKLPGGNFLGRILQPFLGAHRHVSHSIIGVILFAVGAKYFFELINPFVLVDMSIVWVAFLIGLLSHIFMDLLTTEGAPLLFPIDFHFGIPPLKILRIKTGGFREKFLIFPGLILLNGIIFYANYEKYLTLLRFISK